MIRLFLALAICASTAFAAEKNFEDFWEKAVVTVEVTRKQYDFHQPWSRRVDQIQKMGTVINGHEILTTAETCRYLKVAPRTLYRYIREKRVPAFKLGKDWRFVKSELEMWLLRKSREQLRRGPRVKPMRKRP